jgi:hypothetical protein
MLVPIPFLGWFSDEEKREPLNQEMIFNIANQIFDLRGTNEAVLEFAREIERAHEIY